MSNIDYQALREAAEGIAYFAAEPPQEVNRG